MPSLAHRLLRLLSRVLADVLGLAVAQRPARTATPRRMTPGRRHARRRPLHAARPVARRPSRTALGRCVRGAPKTRSQAPKCTPPRLKSFLEKTLTAHARPQFTDPQRLHSHPNRRPMQTPARWVKGLAT